MNKQELIEVVEKDIEALEDGQMEKRFPWAKKVAPSSKDDKYLGGVIENWWPNCNDNGEVVMVYGYIYHDNRWSDGTNIRTSYVVELVYDEDTQTGFVETRNTVYTLGKKWSRE